MRERRAERLWKASEALPNSELFTSVAISIACVADVPPGVCAALRVKFYAAIIVVVATTAHAEDLQAVEAAVKEQTVISTLPMGNGSHPTRARSAGPSATPKANLATQFTL